MFDPLINNAKEPRGRSNAHGRSMTDGVRVGQEFCVQASRLQSKVWGFFKLPRCSYALPRLRRFINDNEVARVLFVEGRPDGQE